MRKNYSEKIQNCKIVRNNYRFFFKNKKVKTKMKETNYGYNNNEGHNISLEASNEM